MSQTFAFHRFWAMVYKEFIQMRRDPGTLAIMLFVPIMQLVLFGFAINTNPKNLPTVLIVSDHSEFTRRFLSAVEKTEYFKIVHVTSKETDAQQWLKLSRAQFIISIPSDFTKKLIRNEYPSILVEADGSDPIANGRALASVSALAYSVFDHELKGALTYLNGKRPPFEVRVHAQYNPLAETRYFIIPGLLGVVLTMTMVIVTALAITRERERGTMEMLLSTPTRALEMMLGKVVPYIAVGYVQVSVILIFAKILFHIPIQGSVPLLFFLCFPFIVANLVMGLTFSTIATNQLQASQGAIFFFLPSLLLSGFMFPYYGMPIWAQWIGSALPLMHFLVIARGIILKGSHLSELISQIVPMLIFSLVVIALGFKKFKQTLD